MLDLITFPLGHASLLWGWLNEFPERNLDDQGPKSAEDLKISLGSLVLSGGLLWEATLDGVPVGAIAMKQEFQGWKFAGICFTERVHGKGIAREAVRRVLEMQFNRGVRTVRADFFADNRRVDRLLEKLGARGDGLLSSMNTRNGKMVMWRRVTITADAFSEHNRRASDQVGSLPAADLQGVAR